MAGAPLGEDMGGAAFGRERASSVHAEQLLPLRSELRQTAYSALNLMTDCAATQKE